MVRANLETDFVHGGLTFVVIFDVDGLRVRNLRILTWDNDDVENPSESLIAAATDAAERFAVDVRNGVAA